MRLSIHAMARRLIPGLIFGFLVLIVLALLGDLRAVSHSLSQFHWEYFLAALGLTLVNYILRFFKWHYYLGQIGARGLPWQRSMRMFVAGFPLAVTPGKIGEALKGIWINRLTGIPTGRGISVVVAERISDGLAMMILSTLGVIAYPRYWPAFAMILALLLAVVTLSQVRPAAYFLLGLGEKLPLVNRIAHGLREFYEGSFALFRPSTTLLAVTLGTISWVGEGIGFYCILLGLGLAPSRDLLVSAIFILAFSTVIGAASALPGGLGAAEVSIAGMLTLILGESPALATSATLLIRLATLWFGVALGLVTWTFSGDLLGMGTEGPAGAENPAGAEGPTGMDNPGSATR
ncbi:MAG TPA: lysylphosphatidylglycerol synthase transmembrane domain-containing protein [Anaerolineaceae bacterium]